MFSKLPKRNVNSPKDHFILNNLKFRRYKGHSANLKHSCIQYNGEFIEGTKVLAHQDYLNCLIFHWFMVVAQNLVTSSIDYCSLLLLLKMITYQIIQQIAMDEPLMPSSLTPIHKYFCPAPKSIQIFRYPTSLCDKVGGRIRFTLFHSGEGGRSVFNKKYSLTHKLWTF